MNGTVVIQLVAQLLALFPTLIPAVRTVVESVQDVFNNKEEVTADDIKAIVDKAVANHAVAVALLKPAE